MRKAAFAAAATAMLLAPHAARSQDAGLGGLVGGVGNVVGGTVGAVGNTVGGTVGAVGNTVGGTVGAVGNTVGGTVGAVGNTVGAVGNAVGGTVGAVGNVVGGTVGAVGSTVSGTLGAVGNTVGGTLGAVGNTVGGTLGAVGNTVGGTVSAVGRTVGGTVGTVGGTVGGLGASIGSTPALSGGGGTTGGAIGGLSGGGALGGGATGGGLAGGGLAGGAVGAGGSLGARVRSADPVTTASLPSGVGSSFGPGSGAGPIAAISLPASLAPLDLVGRARVTVLFPGIGQVSGTREDLQRFRRPLRNRSGTPQQIVKNARDTIAASALPYGVVRVDAASAGPMRRTAGGYIAPIEVRVVYSRQGGIETRQSIVNFRLNSDGRVIAAA